MDTDDGRGGIVGLFSRLADTAIGFIQTRVELFAVELQEEKCRLVETFLLAAAAAALGVIALTLLSLGIVLLLWEEARLIAVFALGAIYLIGACVAVRALNLRLRDRPAFSATNEELKKDRQWLNSRK